MAISQNNNFDWEVYIANYPDLLVILTQKDALAHYAEAGQMENRTDEVPDIFDAEKYSKTFPHLSLKNYK